MKKVFALIMTLMMIFAFTACGSQDQEASAATNYETTGTVQEVGNGEITIETQSDEVLTFNIENAEINLNGLTVLTGKTDTRKEYIAKALFGIIHGLYDFDDQVAEAITKKGRCE